MWSCYDWVYCCCRPSVNIQCGRVIFVIGQDWGKKPHNHNVEKYFDEQGKKVYQIQYHPRTSSTQIKKNIITQFQKDTKK
jgi:hypothetical protein